MKSCFLFLMLLVVAGCGGTSSKVLISGTVTFNKEPVEQGMISFTPIDGHSESAEAIITQGKYEVEAPPGKKLVKISGTKVIGSRPAYEGVADSPMIEERQQYIPANFNDQSTLQKEITKTETIAFDL